MKSLLFDIEGADKLNRLVQFQIASHLFIVCNYNPTTFNLLSEDARFQQGILNLYKFAIDTSLIHKIRRIDEELGRVVWQKNKNDFIELSKHIETISVLRTYIAHNNNNNETVSKAEAWIRKVIHKNKFELIDDYKVAFKELEKIGIELYDSTDRIIRNFAKEYTKEKVGSVFQKYIILFYESNDKIIREAIRSEYRILVNHQGSIKDGLLADWCQRMYVGNREKQISFLSSYLPSVKGDTKMKIENKIEQIRNEIEEIQLAIAKQYCNGDKTLLRSYDYLNYYCTNFGIKCQERLPEVIKNKLTMLPQDMVQFIVCEDFKGVPVTES